MKLNDAFFHFSRHAAQHVGHPTAFVVAVLVIVVWAVTGPIFGWSDTWQLVINTSTTIVTFLMVFLIQNTQNRDAKAIHLKLDELIFSLKNARNALVDLEEATEDEIKELRDQFSKLAARKRLRQGAKEKER